MGGNSNGNLPSMSIPILTEKNWDRWCTQMKVLFSFQEVNDVIETAFPVPDNNASDAQKSTYKENQKKDNKALFLLHQCVNDVHFEKLQNAKTAKEAWDILVRSHEGSDRVKKVKLQALRRQHEMLHMSEGEKICEYFNKIVTLTNQMKSCGEVITDLMIMEKVMRSLPQKFDHVVAAIEEAKDLSKMTIEELQSSLEAHEMRLAERVQVNKTEQALKASHYRDDDKKKKKKWKSKREVTKKDGIRILIKGSKIQIGQKPQRKEDGKERSKRSEIRRM